MNTNQYRCVVNSLCSGSTTSDAAILYVHDDNTIITSQPRDTTVCIGDTAYFTATAAGNNLQYQWQRLLPDYTYADIAGANSNTLALPSLDGSVYRCRIMSRCSAVFTGLARGYYWLEPAFYPERIAYACEGELVGAFAFYNLSISANYQWMVSTDSGITYTNLPGQTSYVLHDTMTTAKHGYRYKCYVSNPCYFGYSNIITLYSLSIAPLSVLSQTHTQNACAGVQTRIYVDAGTASAEYRWQISNDNGNIFTDLPYNDGMHSNVTAAAMEILPNTPGTFIYRCKVISSCNPLIYSAPVTLTVTPNPNTRDTSLLALCDTCKINLLQSLDLTDIDSLAFNLVDENTATSVNADATSAGLGRYKLKIFDSASCYSISNIRIDIKKMDTLKMCLHGSATFVSPLSGTSYQWQINRGYGNGFENIIDTSSGYTYPYANGSLTSTLHIFGIASPSLIRCKVNGTAYSNTFFINFTNYWTGAVSNAWEDPRNWTCGMPRYFSDVIIPGNLQRYPVIGSPKQYCRRLIIEPGAGITIKSGMELVADDYFQY